MAVAVRTCPLLPMIFPSLCSEQQRDSRADYGTKLHQTLGQNPDFLGRSSLLVWTGLVGLSCKELRCRVVNGDVLRRRIQSLDYTGNPWILIRCWRGLGWGFM